MAKPAVILVGADKGGVGKTTVSRTLLDYFIAHNIPIRAFDTESPKGTLRRFHPDITEVVDITSTADQMKMFDTRQHRECPDHGDRRPRRPAVDRRCRRCATSASSTRPRRASSLSRVFHILGPSIASLDEIAETASYHGRCPLLPGEELHQQHAPSSSGTRRPTTPISRGSRAPTRSPSRSSTRWRASRSSSRRCRSSRSSPTRSADGEAANYSFVLRGYVRHWLGNVWAEFDRMKLNDIVAQDAQRERSQARQERAG